MVDKRVKNNLLLFFISVLLIVITIAAYFQQKQVLYKEQELKTLKINYTKKENTNSSYSNILKGINNKEYVRIKRIVKENEIDHVVNIELEIKGEIEKLYSFLEMINKKNNFYGVKELEIKTLDNKKFISYVTLKFLI
ncbi:hypothetical protein [Clostridium sp. ZS2-4]|uniref:hypothetical protein n=1 Tax=Clostridium sp. ZS2-4 TaxID=2987703 RepID=UPI00227B7B30|nr:hypothetical protein [Clostridium sp. ZS2-4]MCY6354064.1 hypothetical protein [Clostridium sp. ZS2-4]